MTRLLSGAAMALMLVATHIHAQAISHDSATALASDCRGFNGIYVNAWWGGGGRDSTARHDSSGIRLDGRTRLDTTLTFNVAERRWTRPSVQAVVLAGASSARSATAMTPTAGTTAAAGSGGAGREWHICTGASLSGQQPTLLLRGVRGQMRLKVDLTPLASIRGGGLGDSTSTPRR